MATLKEILLADDKRARLIDDCVALIDREVAAKSGLSGMAVKGAFAVVKKIKPSIVEEAVRRLIGDFINALEADYATTLAAGNGNFAAHLLGNSRQVADALLAVTDRRMDGAQNKTVIAAYGKLRPAAVKHVEAAVPGIAELIQTNLDA